MKKVIVSSFHSGSILALYKKPYTFDCVVSFDSHVDARLGGYRQEVVGIVSHNLSLQLVAGRAAAHVMFRNTFNNLNELILVISKTCFESDTGWTNFEIAKRMSSSGSSQIREKFSKNFHGVNPNQEKEYLKLAWNIDVVNCPPKDPIVEIKNLMKGKSPLFDIDVDYFGEMQNECYTPMIGAEKSDLGNLERTIKLIKKVKPNVITLSEATVEALENEESKTNYLLDKLANFGYMRDDFFIFTDDQEARYYLDKWEEFQKYYLENTSHSFVETGKIFSQESSEELGGMVKEFFKDDLSF